MDDDGEALEGIQEGDKGKEQGIREKNRGAARRIVLDM